MEWKTSDQPVSYEYAVRFMEARVAAIRDRLEDEMVWLLEHPPLYTAGTSARAEDLIKPAFPVFETGRGGQYTYHGPGQRVAYAMLDLRRRQKQPDIKRYVWQLEEWIIRSLADFGINGERREGRVGIWVKVPPHPSSRCSDTLSPTGSGKSGESREGDGEWTEKKIAAIGVRVRHWVTYHGISINLNPDLSHFEGIVPCGISEHGVTSFEDLGVKAAMAELDAVLKAKFSDVFEGA